ncbi:MAG TPA: DUF2147 domain-containing protein [Bradyrhizobium sp.]|jgi:uncharacterized protein (DUF2147 family)|nr:DUF2147 domain-containing protein [Bradyrhizobium sp.]
MKKCLAIAVLLLASTTAQAQYTFDYGGRTITIDPDRGTVSIPGVYDNTGKKAKRSRSEDGDPDRPGKKAPQQAKTAPQAAPETATPPAPAEQATAPAAAPAPTAPASTAPAPATASRGETSSATAAVAPAGAAAPAPQLQPSAPAVEPAPAPVAAPQPAPAAQKQAAAPATSTPSPANSPLGVWLTEEKEGKVRIEQCGPNLCGYSVDKKSNQNGEQVLINMKPGKDKWSGRILDPTSGSTYDSTIALKGTDSLRVQGCAFGGVFCGGQTWTRVN